VSRANDLIAGRYRLVHRVGAGGMGVVWEARDERLDRPVAVKLLRSVLEVSEDAAELANSRAMREARITARLDHPHAVSLLDVVDDDGRPCLVMELVPSVSLAVLIKGLEVLSVQEATRLGVEVGSALAAAHQLGIVHGDVKPANILIGDDGGARISDFGISNAVDEVTPGLSDMVHGTPAFLAPEVARGGRPGFASDVFGLGATLYTSVEGVPPFGNDPDPLELMRRVAAGHIEPPRVAGELRPLLLRMLAADPVNRPSMAQVVSGLTTLSGRETAPAGRLVGPPAAPVAGLASPPSTAAASAEPAGPPATEHRGRRAAAPATAAAAVATLLSLAILAVALLPALTTRGDSPARPVTPPPKLPLYTSSTFTVPFDVAAPTWVTPQPTVDEPEFVTWKAPEVGVRFLLPTTVYPPGRRGPAAPPRNYLAYLLDQTSRGARISDQRSTPVGGRPAVLLTATANRRLSGAVGCSRATLPAPRCFGLRPERRLRLAVVDVDGRTLLIWLRNDRATGFREQSRLFEEMLATVHFR
jgi:eukaryotic-like serine/threonine-protein kinase